RRKNRQSHLRNQGRAHLRNGDIDARVLSRHAAERSGGDAARDLKRGAEVDTVPEVGLRSVGEGRQMPANLPPQYLKAEEVFRKRPTPEARLEVVREMFRLLPKHKGTEKLQSDLKQKMSRLRDETERGKAGGKKSGVSHRVPTEGAGQVVLVGAPNVGKSSL